MSCNNNNINYDTFSFHKEKIINSIYEENVQVIFREKFNQILQKIKNVEVRNWFIEELTQRLGDKSYVYDKMSIIESLDFIEKECFGIKNIQNISNQEEEDEEDEEDDEDDEEDEEDEEEDEEDEEEDEDEIKETFIGNIFNNVFEGFKIKNVFEGFKIKKKFKKAKKSVSKKDEPVYKPISKNVVAPVSKNVIAPISKNVAPIVEPISKNIKPVSSKNKKKKKKKKQKKKTNRY